MTELTTAAPWFSIISSQEAFILSKPYISLTSLTTLRFWITLVTDTQRRREYNRLQRVVFGSTGHLLGESYAEVTNYMEKGSSWKVSNRSATQEIRLFITPKVSLRVHKSPPLAPILLPPYVVFNITPPFDLRFSKGAPTQSFPIKLILRSTSFALWIPTVHIQAI